MNNTAEKLKQINEVITDNLDESFKTLFSSLRKEANKRPANTETVATTTELPKESSIYKEDLNSYLTTNLMIDTFYTKCKKLNYKGKKSV